MVVSDPAKPPRQRGRFVMFLQWHADWGTLYRMGAGRVRLL